MNSSPRAGRLSRSLAVAIHAQRLWQMALFVLTVAVCYLALVPEPPQELSFGWDKLNHIAAFAALTLSGCFGFPGSRRAVVGVLVGMLLLGVMIEIIQAFVPGRSADWVDLVGDAIGMAMGATLALTALKLARRAQVRA